MVKAKPLPPIDELRKKFAYRSDGVLIWKRPEGRKIKSGSVAGWIDRNGYLSIQTRNVAYRAHRVIWAILKREDPLDYQIDHINGNKLDNRVENLRKATQRQNTFNRKNVKGCSFHIRKNKWDARIMIDGKIRNLGSFDTQEQAREAYLRAKEKLHGEFMPFNMKHELGHIDGTTSQFDLFND